MSLPLQGPRSGLFVRLLAGLLLAAGCGPKPRSASGPETTPPGNSAGQAQPARAR